MTARPFKRSGLHRLDCAAMMCDGYVYATVAQCEQGLPACRCGSRFVPVEVELAEILGLEDCAAVDEYRREIESIWHGQEAHGKRLGGAKLREPHDLAMARISRRRREDARQRRISALLPTPEPMPF